MHGGTTSARAKEVFHQPTGLVTPRGVSVRGGQARLLQTLGKSRIPTPCPGAAGAWVAVGGRGRHSPAVNPGHGAGGAYMPPTAQSGSPQRCLTIRRM